MLTPIMSQVPDLIKIDYEHDYGHDWVMSIYDIYFPNETSQVSESQSTQVRQTDDLSMSPDQASSIDLQTAEPTMNVLVDISSNNVVKRPNSLTIATSLQEMNAAENPIPSVMEVEEDSLTVEDSEYQRQVTPQEETNNLPHSNTKPSLTLKANGGPEEKDGSEIQRKRKVKSKVSAKKEETEEAFIDDDINEVTIMNFEKFTTKRVRIDPEAAYFMTGVIEGVLDFTFRKIANIWREFSVGEEIEARDILMGVSTDRDLGHLFHSVIIPGAGTSSYRR